MGEIVKEFFDKDGNFVRRSVSFVCDGPSMTKQSESDACDVNKIMKQYERTGYLPPADDLGFYADVSSVPDYQAALAIVEKASFVFDSLPGEFRARMDNDPAKYLAWVADPANRAEMVKLGMIVEAVAAPVAVPVPVVAPVDAVVK